MSERYIPIEDLRHVAQLFSKANKESRATLKRLEEATKRLEEKWAGATSHIFFKHYTSFRSQMESSATHMELIARELEAMADRFEAVDG